MKKVLHVHCFRTNNKLIFTGDEVVLCLIEDIVHNPEFTKLVKKIYLSRHDIC